MITALLARRMDYRRLKEQFFGFSKYLDLFLRLQHQALKEMWRVIAPILSTLNGDLLA